MNQLILEISAQEILSATGLDFTGNLYILADRLANKSVNQLIAEIKEQQAVEETYTVA